MSDDTTTTIPVYTESEMDSKLADHGYVESSGFFSQNAALNNLTTQNADHFIFEAISARNDPYVLSTSFNLPLFGKITLLPNPIEPLSQPLYTFYKQRNVPLTKITYTIITNTSKGILVYVLPVQPQ